MSVAWLKSIVGQAPLPETVPELAAMVEFAEAHHVLGQMAAAWGDKVDGKLKDVLENGLLRTGFDHRMLQFEIDRLERALIGKDVQPILLKGAAYVATGNKAGRGRRVSDIDILVSDTELEQVERSLLKAGWSFELGVDNEYDKAYYRKYMHELPPLRHDKRRTIMDVHHRLLPRTSRHKVRSELMAEAAITIEGCSLRAFTPTDMFIHSAIHTFTDGAFDTPARSLLELHYLLDDLEESERAHLQDRALEVGAEKAVDTALWALARLYGDSIAEKICKHSRKPLRPNSRLVRWAIKQKLERIDDAATAKFILYVRSHFMRMPLHLLIGHITRKAVRGLGSLVKREVPQRS